MSASAQDGSAGTIGRAQPRSARRRPDGRIGVVTLVDRLAIGGAERLAAEISMRLDPARYASTLCISRLTDPAGIYSADIPEQLQANVEACGVNFIGMSRGRSWELRPWRPLLRLLRSGNVQVIHSHMHGSNIWAVVLGRLMRVPVVVTHEHTWEFSGQPVRQFLDRYLIAAGSDILIACSEEDRRRMTDVEGIPPRSTMYLPNGIEGRAPTPGRDIRAELGIAAGAPVIGCVGVMRTQKRLDVLLHAIKALVPRFPDLRLMLVGDGSERANVEAIVAELGLAQTVMMLGSRRDVPDMLEAFDVAAVSSDFEGSPLAVMEYMEAGIPVVSTAVGGLPRMIHDGVHGLLVAPNDPAALAAAIAELLADPQRRAEMGAAARERRRAEYDLDVMVARVEDLYEQLLAAR